MAEQATAAPVGPATADVLMLPERVNIGNVVEVMASLEGDCNAQRQSSAVHCSVDLSRLTDFDSTVLSMLLEMGRRAGKPLAVINPPDKLVALAQLYGVSELLLSPQDGGGSA